MGFDFDDIDDQSEERDNLREMNRKLLAVLGSEGGQGHLGYLRSVCRNKWQYEFESREQLGLMPIYREHNQDPAWHSATNASHKDEDAEIGEQTKSLTALMTFHPLGPLGIDKGEFVEVTGMTEEPVNGVLHSWSDEHSVYVVHVPHKDPMHPKPEAIKKLHDLERVRAVQDELVKALSTTAAQREIDQARDSSMDYIEYMSMLGPIVQKLTNPVYEIYSIDVAWQQRAISWQAGEASIKTTGARIVELTAWNRPCGPNNFEKGGFCEVHGLKGEAERDSYKNGTVVVIRNWDGVTKYEVAPVENPRNIKSIRKANLQAATPTAFKFMDDATAFQLAMKAVYDSPGAQEMVGRLKGEIPEIRAYTAAMKREVLALQAPLLEKFGFTADILGQAYVKRSLATYSINPGIAHRTGELEAFGKKDLRFDGRVAIVTGGGRGLGRAYCRLLAARGAMVVVNNRTPHLADEVVAMIQSFGGVACADHHDVAAEGDKIVQTAVNTFGKVDIIIVNAGQLEDRRFEVMQPEHWNGIVNTHVFGHMKLLMAAWPYFKGYKFGRVVLTSSTTGTFGNGGQSNYGSAKSALLAIGQTLAMEGYKYGIHVNVLLPEALTRMTDELKPEMFRVGEEGLKSVAQPVALPVVYLCHETCVATGEVIWAKDGTVCPMRLQQDEEYVDISGSKGIDALDDCGAQWSEMAAFERVSYPGQDIHWQALWGVAPTPVAKGGKKGKGSLELKFTNRVAVVANAGRGLGKTVALMLAQRGCKVYVHDRDYGAAEAVVGEIAAAGGTAVPDASHCGDGAVKAAIATDDQVDIVIANIQPVKDTPFEELPWHEFEGGYNDQAVQAFYLIKSVWGQMYMQKYGRIVIISGECGLHGYNNNTTNAAIKGSVMGLGLTLALEGYQYGIFSNCVYADSLVGDVPLPHAAPLAFLCHESCRSTAGLYRAEAGYAQALRWQRDEAFVRFNAGKGDSELESVAAEWLDEPKYSVVSYPGQEIHMSYRPHLAR